MEESGSRGRSQENQTPDQGSNAAPVINERTSLLSSVNGSTPNYVHHSNIAILEADEDGSDESIDPNDFDILLARSESITTGLGIEVQSQETPMLRGPRRYTNSRSGSLPRSFHPVRRPSSSTISSSIFKDSDDEDDLKNKSPYMAGVSVPRFWLIFTGLMIALFVACFDSTIMVSSHPVITSYFHSSNSASWLSTSFLLTSTAFQPIFGRLSDTIGRKTPYLFTAVIFLGATVWCACAQSMTSFIIARAVCGLGAGGMMTLGSIITGDLVPIEIRGVFQSYINITFGVASALGAALGGAIADHLGWRWEFGIQVPLVFLVLVIIWVSVPRKLGLADGVEKKTIWGAMKVFDIKGSILLTTSITFLILGLNLGGNVFDWSHPFIVSSLFIFCACFPLFILVEASVDLPIMPLGLITHYPRSGLMLANFAGAMAMNAIVFNIPLYFQAVLLESATSSGLRLIIPILAASISGTLSGFLITWTRELKLLLVFGVLFLLFGTAILPFMQRNMATWVYVAMLVPSHIGQGFLFPTTFMAVLAVSEQSEQAVVTSTLVLWRSIGMVLGVALSSLVLQNALFYYLQLNVVGPNKDMVIQQVRKSVQAIVDLDPVSREQVIASYSSSLRLVFVLSTVISVVTVALTLPVKLPKLGRRK